MRITQDEQILLNAARKELALLDKEEKRISKLMRDIEILEKKTLGTRPKAYTLEMNFELGVLTTVAENFVISTGDFHCHAISTNISVVARAAIRDYAGVGPYAAKPGQLVDVSLPQESKMFDFLWQIREDGRGGYLQDHPQPSVVLNSGHASPKVLPVPLCLKQGTTVDVEVTPTRSASTAIFATGFLQFQDVSRFKLLFKFWGEEQL